MKKLLLLLAVCLQVIMYVGCNDSDNTEYVDIVVASTKVPVNMRGINEEPYYEPCLMVKYSKDADSWSVFSAPIEGFDYEEGYEYKLQLIASYEEYKCNGYTYQLNKILSKEKKNSEGLPEKVDRVEK